MKARVLKWPREKHAMSMDIGKPGQYMFSVGCVSDITYRDNEGIAAHTVWMKLLGVRR